MARHLGVCSQGVAAVQKWHLSLRPLPPLVLLSCFLLLASHGADGSRAGPSAPPWMLLSLSLLAPQHFAGASNAKPDPFPWRVGKFTLDGRDTGFRYDGHGAISSGGTSRLLYDYPEPQRGEILDYLFKPRYGASLHMLKVEIGGDAQSGYGTEPSHMHLQSETSCKRGLEFWLLTEARKRNPRIVLYALTWAVPGWVGEDPFQDGLYSQDGIDYLMAWLRCAREHGVGLIDYMGHRSARPWGPSRDGRGGPPTGNWTVQLRSALDAGGFAETRLVLPDNAWDASVLDVAAESSAFASSFDVVGLHYPCSTIKPEVRQAGYAYWSTEDGAVTGTWRGAGCVGRTLNTNFVWQNMSSTLIRSLVWSVYKGLTHKLSDGLIDAFEPWSGRYTVHPTLWVMAHTTQFVDVGWRILSAFGPQPGQPGSSGSLSNGGSYVTYASPRNEHFTTVIEKLNGECPTCTGNAMTKEEDIEFTLKDWLLNCLGSDRSLKLWMSNESHHFVQLPNLIVDENDKISLVVKTDTIYTITTTTGQSRGNDHEVVLSQHVANVSASALQIQALGEASSGDSMSSANAIANASNNASNVSRSEMLGCATNASNVSGPCDGALNRNLTNTSGMPSSDRGTNEDYFVLSDPLPLQRGHVAPAGVDFALPVLHDFESYAVDDSVKMLADYAGSWQIASDPTRPSNLVLKQWVSKRSGDNQWVPEADPLAVMGSDLKDVAVSAVMYMTHSSARLPVPSGRGPVLVGIQSPWSSLCLATASGAFYRGAPVVQRECTLEFDGRFRYDPATGRLAATPKPNWAAFSASPDAPPDVSMSAVGRPGTAAPARGGRDVLIDTPSVRPGAPRHETYVPGVALCLTGLGCPTAAKEYSDLCLLECGAQQEPQKSGQVWVWGDDGTLRLRSRSSMCVTAIGSKRAAGGPTSSRLMPCGAEGAEYRQQWMKTNSGLAMHVGVCARLSAPDFGMTGRERTRQGYCLTLGIDEHNNGRWQLEKSGLVVLAQGPLTDPIGVWHSALLQVHGSRLLAMVDGHIVARENDGDYGSGMVGVSSGWGTAYFDDFAMEHALGEAHWELGGAPGRFYPAPRQVQWPAGFGWPP